MAKLDKDKLPDLGKPDSREFRTGRNKWNRGPLLAGDDDLVIRDEAGNYFWLTKDEYQKAAIPLDGGERGKMKALLQFLINEGTVMADIPPGGLKSVKGACYLINLEAIRRPSPKFTAVRPNKVGEAADSASSQPHPGESHGIHGEG